jgi:hypothetical protein
MRRLPAALCLSLAATAALCAPAQADPAEYEIVSASASATSDEAGAHPDFTLSFALRSEKDEGKTLPATTRDIEIELPAGLLANPSAVTKCTTAQLVSTDSEDPTNATGCPQASQVGVSEVTLCKAGSCTPITEPVFNVASPGGDVAARLGFFALLYPVVIDARLRSEDDYGATVTTEGAGALIPLLSAKTTTWGIPADESHDFQRITPYEAAHTGGVPDTPDGKRESGLVPRPFMVNPTRCGVPREVRITATSYALPDQPVSATAQMGPVTGCGALDFEPGASFSPTTKAADSPSGMDVELTIPQSGLEDPAVPATPHLKRTIVTLPEGLTLNPAAAGGLGACTSAQIGLISKSPPRFDANPPACPQASKVGTAQIETPLLEAPLQGALYLAHQADNPFDTLLAGYLAVRGQGVSIKLAGRFELLPGGRIVAVFDESPQAPFGRATLHFKEGARGALITPPACGAYSIRSELSPWSAADPFNPTAAETVAKDSPFSIHSGPGGSPCPAGRFSPALEAGATNPIAARHSPFVFRLARADGEERLARVSTVLPRGLTARLRGIPYCPEAALAAASARGGLGQGALELASPSCPAASRVGMAIAGAGAGPTPFYLRTARVYLAGPYRGAPLSLAAIAPAVAGPFDLGAVVVRVALHVDPRSAQASAVSDPLPTALHDVPLALRDVRILVERERFMLNPTSCAEKGVAAAMTSEQGRSATATQRFRVGGCRGLRFRPRLGIRLFGPTNRGAHPRLRAVLRPRRGEANLRRASAALPRTAFLDQSHIRTVCTRVQFAAGRCPRGSVYGRAAAFTPLLDEPLRGPVYLRSSDNLLPDLVAAFKGQIEAQAVARIDSVRGGIRTTFTGVPDAPISKVVLNMQGARKGLLINSRDICKARPRATVRLAAHNGRRLVRRPELRDRCSRGKAR